ncbi:MAG: hypothetical protein GXY80_15340 [Syntrophorhabdus aromaticivorans]|uniref:Uncharacterized protein n=1 Tax=Syntrophorhabdus aromaticivorans TaxID=328301 RepID=A0A971S1S8_9BACT|nr:hypothetical protein [Syntrophorhabdus aromaticivorans]
MSFNIAKEVAALGRLTVKDLRAKHVEVFGEAIRRELQTIAPAGVDCPATDVNELYG